MAGLTRQLAEFACSLDYRNVPAKALETAKRGFIDCVGVMFAGRDEAVSQILFKARLFPERNEAHIHFDRGTTSSADAALLNASSTTPRAKQRRPRPA